MISVTDIGNILYKDCGAFGIPVYQKGNVPTGKVDSERIVIYPKVQQDLVYWRESFVEVNICVPDVSENTADLIKLNDMERKARQLIGYSTGIYDGTRYRYKIDTIGIEQDPGLACHYVNATILFKVINVM